MRHFRAFEPFTRLQRAIEEGAHKSLSLFFQVLFFVISAVKSGDAAALSSTIVPLLHPIMAVQEVSDQDFALLAKQALAYLKYLPLPSSALPGAAGEIVAAAGVANWHTRAAALVFLQAFAYRHAFLLEGADLHRLREAVLGLLSDTQLEVRMCSAALYALCGPHKKKFSQVTCLVLRH